MTIVRPILNRRAVLTGLGAATFVSARGAKAATPLVERSPLVVIVLRGAMDGLGAVPYVGDDRLRAMRPDLVGDDVLSLTNGFGLNSALAGLHEMFGAGEASVLHAVAGPYRERSHFLAQDLLESGTLRDVEAEGWLNRALQVAPSPLSAVSIGPATPLILRGSVATSTWSPPVLPEVDVDTIQRLQDMYAGDALLGPALADAVALDEIAGPSRMKGGRRSDDVTALKAAAKLLSAPLGPDIAVVSLGNWDTHANQAGALARRLGQLDAGLTALKAELGPLWDRTLVTVVTEFGRTVRQNGTRGTDHGTGGAAFVLGGAHKGGRMLGHWPGLGEGDLYENRDLYPANDVRSLFKAALEKQFGFSQVALSKSVFPASVGVPAMVGV